MNSSQKAMKPSDDIKNMRMKICEWRSTQGKVTWGKNSWSAARNMSSDAVWIHYFPGPAQLEGAKTTLPGGLHLLGLWDSGDDDMTQNSSTGQFLAIRLPKTLLNGQAFLSAQSFSFSYFYSFVNWWLFYISLSICFQRTQDVEGRVSSRGWDKQLWRGILVGDSNL